MKTYKQFFTFAFLFFISTALFAQTKNDTIKVNGECGMCKKKIEKAAKASGAASASWSPETKILLVSYNAKNTTSDKIQKAIAGVGYDTEKYKASDDAYNALDECCKYERKVVTATADDKKCCGDENCCKNAEACKDKDCCKDKQVCKEKGCCKDGIMKCCQQSAKGIN